MTSYIVEKWNKGEVYYQMIFGTCVAKDRCVNAEDYEPVGFDLKSEFRPLNKENVKELFEAGLITEVTVEATNKAYKEYLADFFADYTKNQANRTQEEINEQRSEARAAMGSGVKMMNIITGETYTT
jgi:hypothetical protein